MDEHEFLILVKEGKTEDALNMLDSLDEPWNIRSVHGENAVYWASVNNDVVLLEHLLQKGCSANDKNFRGTGPLYYAASKQAYNACVILMKYGADPRETSGFSGMYPDQTATDEALVRLLYNARIKIQTAIDTDPSLHVLYRMRRWGHDCLVRKLHYDTNSSIEWPDNWSFRSDLETIESIPKLSHKLIAEWHQFIDVLYLWHEARDKFPTPCACCSSTVGRKLRCSKCKKVYFCDTSCQKIAWPLHKVLNCK